MLLSQLMLKPQATVLGNHLLHLKYEGDLNQPFYPQTDLLDYPKLSQTYYVLLECLAQDHMAFLATLEPQVARKRNQKRHLLG